MRRLWIIFLVFAIFSCRDSDRVKEPENLIPENKMVEVLTDLSLLNSAKNYNRRQLENTGLRPIEYLYDRHGIDSVSLAQSTRYYANFPSDLERIYSRVKSNLEKLKSTLEHQREEERRVQDSIREAESDSLREQPQDSILQINRFGDSIYVNPEIFRRNPQDSLPPAMEVEFEESDQ
ncbi:DUF4296 domain-containing protein [Antarcticibacterium flavum]|uniref:DUF4296 domain-containing protein n=1 Tax=Antarcticibacterium flavum TaxID=2058175 RepID=A0A5B7X5L5_9FLAO|nr:MULTISPECIES: DUF4296 domain-containing protein [Antarcticibacterium]MCM4159429.1 DUF4296 domain-containing protein [Antarcticibacterium sp. W02-3]QCY69933.1 DUF4296 domain-containing protein [Antarcticibacterium flavum]